MQVDSLKDLIFGVIGGSALLMYGVELMGSGLEKASGGLIKNVLSKATGKLWTSFLTGTAITALVQSSTAVTVLAVGFVNGGLMSFRQAIGIIYGANIGTTITAQLMALDLTEAALPAVAVGYMVMYLSKREEIKYAGQGIFGFGILFLGLKLLNMGVPYIKDNPAVINFFRIYGGSPLVSITMGTLVTIIVQSSSAVMGITMILAGSGLINIEGAVGLMLGSNIGTCATAQIASLAGNIHARRTAWAHTIYNMVGGIMALIFIKPFISLVLFISPGISIERQVANSHTLFNILSAAAFLPFTNHYIKIIEALVPGKNKINRRI